MFKMYMIFIISRKINQLVFLLVRMRAYKNDVWVRQNDVILFLNTYA